MKKKYYTLDQAIKKIFFTYGKKRRLIFEFFYLFLTLNFIHKISAFITMFICKNFGYEKYNNSKILKILLFTGIRGMKQSDIFNIREKHFLTLKNKIAVKSYNGLDQSISEIRENGFCNVSKLFDLSEQDVNEVNNFFLKEKFYNGHEPMQSNLKKMTFDELKKLKRCNESLIFDRGYYSFDIETQLKNNIVKELYNSKVLKDLSDAYCGFETEPYTILTMLNLPNKDAHPVTDYHRDPDDYIFLGFFIYWTDTNINNGATTFKIKSHKKEFKDGIGEKILEVKPGSIIAGDWMGLHKGNEKIENDKYRLVTMIRFGKKFNHTYIQTKSYYFI